MATIETSIKMTDKASPTINKISSALDKANSHCKKLNDTSEKLFDTSAIDKTNSKLNQTSNKFSQIDENVKQAVSSNQKLSDGIKITTNLTDILGKKIKALVLAFGSVALVKKSIDFIKKSMENAQIQANAELQLNVVLKNAGATQDAFDEIVKKASEIQARGIFGDEAMIAGAAELSTYMSDKNAIKTMMDTLANYAIGMSNGKAVDSSGMVDYATNLGKVLNGAYDAMSKKGFKFSEAQKAIISGTATHAQYVEVLGENYKQMTEDMQKATTINAVIQEAWGGLYETMSDTPVGKLTQLKNALGDISEKAGQILSSSLTEFFNTLIKHLPQIETAITGFAKALNVAFDILNKILDVSGNIFEYFQKNWEQIDVIVTVATGALAVFALGLNSVWIIVIALIVALNKMTEIINKHTGQTLSSIGIISGAVTWLGALVWNIIAYTWNILISLAEFVANFLVNPFGTLQGLFAKLMAFIFRALDEFVGNSSDAATKFANSMIKAINLVISAWNGFVNIFGGLSSKFFGIELTKGEKIQEISKISFGNLADSASKYAEQKKTLNFADKLKMKEIDFAGAYKSGYDFGASLGSKISDVTKNLLGNGVSGSTEDKINQIAGNTGDTAANTGALSDTLSATDEDLKYLRDLAERDVINKFTTAQIKVDMTNNNSIASDMDIDGVVNVLTQKLNEQLACQVMGVYA